MDEWSGIHSSDMAVDTLLCPCATGWTDEAPLELQTALQMSLDVDCGGTSAVQVCRNRMLVEKLTFDVRLAPRSAHARHAPPCNQGGYADYSVHGGRLAPSICLLLGQVVLVQACA